MEIRKAEVTLRKAQDGIWLDIDTDSGKRASFHIGNCFSGSGLANRVINEWAEDQFKNVKKGIDDPCPQCGAQLISKMSGGVECSSCGYWFCF